MMSPNWSLPRLLALLGGGPVVSKDELHEFFVNMFQKRGPDINRDEVAQKFATLISLNLEIRGGRGEAPCNASFAMQLGKFDGEWQVSSPECVWMIVNS